MRTLITNLLAAALLFVGASTASAFALHASLNPASADTSSVLSPSDMIAVDVYLDADQPGITIFSVALTFDDDGILEYVPGPNGAPGCGPYGYSCAFTGDTIVPSYVLYTGGKGATYLRPPTGSIPPAQWAGTNAPGKLQVNLNWQENALGNLAATGTDVWLGTIVFHVAAVGDGASTLELTFSGAATNSTGFSINGTSDVTSQVGTSGTFNITTIQAPEPTTAALIGFGLVGLVVAGRRQRK